MQIYFITLIPMLVIACLGWSLSLRNDNVTVVDSLWAMFFLIATAITFSLLNAPSERAYLILLLVSIWSIRLSSYLHLRNHNKAEDLRYQAIRARNQPNFRYKSIYLVFIFFNTILLVNKQLRLYLLFMSIPNPNKVNTKIR